MDDRQTLVCNQELKLMRKIVETSSDLVKARYWEEFKEAVGGLEKLKKDHEDAVEAWEKYLAEVVPFE